MATTTKPRSSRTSSRTSTARKKKSASAKRSKSSASKSKRSKSARASKKARARRPSSARKSGGGSGSGGPGMFATIRSHIGDRRADVYGLALIAVGLLSGLAVYASAAGPIGDFLEAIWRGLFGVLGALVPIGLAVFGGLVVFDRPNKVVSRIALGTTITTLAVLGSWQLIAGDPQPSDGIRQLWSAGGLLGWATATPLEAGLSVWGAQALLLVLAFLGAVLAAGTTVAKVFERVGEFLLAVPEAVGALTPMPGDELVDAPSGDEVPPVADAPSADDTAPVQRATVPVGETSVPSADEAATAALPRPPLEEPEQVTETEVVKDMRATLAAIETSPTSTGDDAVGETDAVSPGAIGGGLTAADREAGRAPSPPAPVRSNAAEKASRKATKIKPVESWADYQLPPLDLLGEGRSMQAESERTIEAQTQALQATFDQFGIDATVARWSRGPTVTRFEIELGPGVKVNKVGNMGDDIAYALAAPDVRIVAPIPGKSAIGVEVPNRQRDLITLGDILRSDTAASDTHPLFVALGQDIAGNPAMVNLATMPHLLVAGATGSGKSVTLNAMIASILMRARPDEVRMILIDPKRVELGVYNGAPHLLSPVVTDPRRATDAVQWCVKEMEMRYETLARLGFRNIDGYNEAVARGELPDEVDPITDEVTITHEHMPYILLVIDELSDLMMVAARDVEDAICRIAQMARAVGIHMVIATQRPSVDVITGLIKANIPSRLALAVASGTDSRTILDTQGAEKLVGKGDMLFQPASQGKPSRLQGCFLTEREIEPVVTYTKRQREADYIDGVVKEGKEAVKADVSRGDDDSDEALLVRAAEQVVNSGLGSTSMLQRKLRIGFARAGRLMDELEDMGVVGPNEGSKARDVLWSPEEYDNALQQGTFNDVM
ncbi:MAG TPA: DNA translocase FtsK [Nitriliruptoraceae bacterium]|nr:DNA translocase FtsK [Nitriliruptoraceae bacterium]